MSLSLASISFQTLVKATINNQIDGLTAASQVVLGATRQPSVNLANGNGANQANRFWQSTSRILASTASEDIDLHAFTGIDIGGGSGNGPLGGAMALTSIVGLLVVCEPTSVGTITLFGKGTTAGWTSVVAPNTATVGPINPGGWYEHFDPTAAAPVVGASTTNHLLTVLAGTGGAVYSIYVLGRQ